jgi:hypothetical protein
MSKLNTKKDHDLGREKRSLTIFVQQDCMRPQFLFIFLHIGAYKDYVFFL